jgi:hypothetical protein
MWLQTNSPEGIGADLPSVDFYAKDTNQLVRPTPLEGAPQRGAGPRKDYGYRRDGPQQMQPDACQPEGRTQFDEQRTQACLSTKCFE